MRQFCDCGDIKLLPVTHGLLVFSDGALRLSQTSLGLPESVLQANIVDEPADIVAQSCQVQEKQGDEENHDDGDNHGPDLSRGRCFQRRGHVATRGTGRHIGFFF